MLVRSSLVSFLVLSAASPWNVDALSAVAPPSTKIIGARGLGGSDLVVSEACLGTMTWGIQNTREDAFEQLEYARSFGVNFIDTAELYPVPTTSVQWKSGTTEQYLGDYLKMIGSERDELVIATKIAGFLPGSTMPARRVDPSAEGPEAPCRLDAESVKSACDGSLRRLQTDRIDLFQVHWPDRYTPMFGQLAFNPAMKRPDSIPIEETASAMRDLIEEGKIRYIGLSNETPYGVFEWIRATEKLGIRDKLVSIQNSYSLIDRRFDGDLAEICDAEDIGLLPWSVLAGGLLSGKYRDGQPAPADTSRFIQFSDFMTRWSPRSASKATVSAAQEYAEIAENAGMTPSQLAIAFCRTRNFISDTGSVIVGATTMDQLKENLEPFGKDSLELSEETLAAIDEVYMKCRDPACYL